MLDQHNTRLPPPANWQDFEELCLDLLGEIYGIDQVQKYARSGNRQNGIDIIISPSSEHGWIGVQCKQKDVYPEKHLTKNVVEEEVNNATTFKPTISEYIIVTTAPRDKKIQDLAMEITERHRREGKFAVNVWSWDDIEGLLRKNTAVLKRWYPSHQIPDIIETVEKKVDTEHEDTRMVIKDGFRQQREYLSSAIDTTNFTAGSHEELDRIKKELDEQRPSTALRLLNDFRESKWSRATDEIKYRIVTMQGTAEIRLNYLEDGGKKLIQALRYNPHDDKAVLNAALGHILVGECDVAEEFARDVIKRNPLNPLGYTRLIQAKGAKEPIDSIIDQIPKSLLHSQDVAVAVGQHYYFQGDFKEAEQWLNIALENAEGDTLGIKTLLASTKYHAVLADPKSLKGLQIDETSRNTLQDAIHLYDGILNNISGDIDLQRALINVLIERAHIYTLLRHEDLAEADIERAYILDQTNPDILFIKGLDAFQREDYAHAEKYFHHVLWTERFSPTALELFFDCLRKQQRLDDAIELIQRYQERDLTQEQEDVLSSSLLKLYVIKGKEYYEEAENFARIRVQENDASIQRHIDLIKVLHQIGKTPDAIAHIDTVRELFTDSLSYQKQLEIADICHHLNQFDKAAEIYQKLIEPTQDTGYTHRFIDACYFGGHHGQALELCRKLHSVQGPLNHSTNIELAIDLEIGDLSEAKRLCKAFLEKFPDDYEMRVNLAEIYFRDGDVASVESLLSLPYEFEKFSYHSGARLVRLYYYSGRFYEALDLAYRLLKKYSNLPEAHQDYISLFLDLGDEKKGLSDPDVVKLDTSVCYEDQFGENHIITIDSNSLKENTIQDPPASLAQLLLGKPVGTKVSLHNEKDTLFEEDIIIKSIKSKYVHEFQVSIKNFAQRFPGNKEGPRRFPVRHNAEDEINPEDIERLKHAVSRKVDWENPVFEIYKQRKLPIETLANLIQANVFSVCSLLMQSPDLGIYYTPSTQKGHLTALPVLDESATLVIDPIAIATIHSLQIGDLLKQRYKKLGIAKTTVDLIEWAVLEYSGIRGRAHGMLTITNGTLRMWTVPEEVIQKDKKSLEKLLKWVRTNCMVIPCYPSLKYDYLKKQEYNSLFGSASADSILLATLPNHILYSDDALIHLVGRQDFGITSSTSTPNILHDCLNAGILTKEQYCAHILNLTRWHYHPIPISAELLIDSAEQSSWDLNSPFIDLLEGMSPQGQTGDPEVLEIALEFTEHLWAKNIDKRYQDVIFLKLLTTITPRVNADHFIHSYENLILMHPTLSKSAKVDVLTNISLWRSLFQERLRNDETNPIDQSDPSTVQ